MAQYKKHLLHTVSVFLFAFSSASLAIQWPPVLSPDPEVQPPKWDWQLQVPVKLNEDESIEIYDIDMFDNENTGMVAELQSYGKKVICYVDVGSWEDFRDDRDDFPNSILGNIYEGFPDERWLDIRDVNPAKSRTNTALASILEARFDRAMMMGCDGVEPDNMDVYDETAHDPSGFPLTYEDQMFFNLWVADAVHARGMAVGLKNNINQAQDPRVVAAFDFVVSEECFQYDECDYYTGFLDAGKPVFLAEYNRAPHQFCSVTKELRISATRKKNSLNSFRLGCDDYYEDTGTRTIPPVPALLSPVNRSVVTARTPVTVSWEFDNSTTKYHVQVYNRNQNRWMPIISRKAQYICNSSICSIDLPAMDEQRRAFWRVKARNNTGTSAWTYFRDGTFDIAEANVPEVPTIISPAAGASVAANQPVTLTWRKVDSAARYHVQRYDRIAKSWVYKQIHHSDVVCNNDSCSVVTPEMAQQDRAFWRVKAFNLRGGSEFSDYRKSSFNVSSFNVER